MQQITHRPNGLYYQNNAQKSARPQKGSEQNMLSAVGGGDRRFNISTFRSFPMPYLADMIQAVFHAVNVRFGRVEVNRDIYYFRFST